MKSVHEVKRTNTVITCVTDETDYPSLDFYEKFFPLPFTPEERFIGVNTSPHFLLAVESLFTELSLKVRDLNCFFESEKRIDNLKKYDHGTFRSHEMREPFNTDELRFLRWRLLNNSTAWDYLLVQSYRDVPTVWEILEKESSFYNRICLCVWIYRKLDVKSGNGIKNLVPVFDGVEAEDFVKVLQSYTSWSKVKGMSNVNAARISKVYEPSPVLTKLAAGENSIRLAALAKLNTPVENVASEIKNLPLDWAKDILTS